MYFQNIHHKTHRMNRCARRSAEINWNFKFAIPDQTMQCYDCYDFVIIYYVTMLFFQSVKYYWAFKCLLLCWKDFEHQKYWVIPVEIILLPSDIAAFECQNPLFSLIQMDRPLSLNTAINSIFYCYIDALAKSWSRCHLFCAKSWKELRNICPKNCRIKTRAGRRADEINSITVSAIKMAVYKFRKQAEYSLCGKILEGFYNERQRNWKVERASAVANRFFHVMARPRRTLSVVLIPSISKLLTW